jgi:hypothetical protein
VHTIPSHFPNPIKSISLRPTQYGNCYTFNPGSHGYDPISINQNGKDQGLQLELFVGKPNTYNSFSDTIGAKVCENF